MHFLDLRDAGRPRGLLAAYLFSQTANALDFSPLPRKDMPILKNRFSTLVNFEQHDDFLRAVLDTATSEVNIASPWLRQHNAEKSGILTAIGSAVQRGVKVTVFSDQRKNTNTNAIDALANWREMADALDKAGANLINIGNLHSKLVMKDHDILCIGSYNWLSAARAGKYVDHELSEDGVTMC
jgi:phosphatidylserine/phosphatidylglycerophosphate/cardiolipin synthase-like enzyme